MKTTGCVFAILFSLMSTPTMNQVGIWGTPDVVTIQKAYLTPENTFIVEYYVKSNKVYLSDPVTDVPDRYYKEVYGVVNGEIVQIGIINGEETPPVPSHIVWGEMEPILSTTGEKK